MANKKIQSDEELVLEIRNRDKERYAQLVERYQEKLLRYAVYLIKDEQLALDIVQESFIKAYVNLNGFDIKKKFSSWIYRIVHNESMNAVKKYKKEIPLLINVDYGSEEDIEESFFKKEISREAHTCLSQIPVMYREVLTLFYLEEKPYEEISDILRLPLGTIATRLNRAKAIMKKICRKVK